MYDPEQAFFFEGLFQQLDDGIEELRLKFEENSVPPLQAEEFIDLQLKCINYLREIKDQYVSAFDPEEKKKLGKKLMQRMHEYSEALKVE